MIRNQTTWSPVLHQPSIPNVVVFMEHYPQSSGKPASISNLLHFRLPNSFYLHIFRVIFIVIYDPTAARIRIGLIQSNDPPH